MSGSRHTDFSPNYGSYSEAALGPLNCGPGAPGEHCLRQLPTDERAFVEVQVSSTKVLTQCWSKKKCTHIFGHIGEISQ